MLGPDPDQSQARILMQRFMARDPLIGQARFPHLYPKGYTGEPELNFPLVFGDSEISKPALHQLGLRKVLELAGGYEGIISESDRYVLDEHHSRKLFDGMIARIESRCLDTQANLAYEKMQKESPSASQETYAPSRIGPSFKSLFGNRDADHLLDPPNAKMTGAIPWAIAAGREIGFQLQDDVGTAYMGATIKYIGFVIQNALDEKDIKSALTGNPPGNPFSNKYTELFSPCGEKDPPPLAKVLQEASSWGLRFPKLEAGREEPTFLETLSHLEIDPSTHRVSLNSDCKEVLEEAWYALPKSFTSLREHIEMRGLDSYETTNAVGALALHRYVDGTVNADETLKKMNLRQPRVSVGVNVNLTLST
jgi:hypothetical protein